MLSAFFCVNICTDGGKAMWAKLLVSWTKAVTSNWTNNYYTLFIYLFIFAIPHVACRILVPWPGIKAVSLSLEVWSLNHWTAREVSVIVFLNAMYFQFKSIVSFTYNIWWSNKKLIVLHLHLAYISKIIYMTKWEFLLYTKV